MSAIHVRLAPHRPPLEPQHTPHLHLLDRHKLYEPRHDCPRLRFPHVDLLDVQAAVRAGRQWVGSQAGQGAGGDAGVGERCIRVRLRLPVVLPGKGMCREGGACK